MKKYFEITNLRMIKVRFVGATDTRGSRILIEEPKRYNDDKTQRKYFGYSYEHDNVQDQAAEILQRNGWNIVARASDCDAYYFLCDNWAEDFKEVSNLK